MNTYNLILFLHMLSAFGILTAFVLEWAGLAELQRSCTNGQARESLRSFRILPWIGGPSYLVALLSGIYLWSELWRGTAWTIVSIVSLIVLAVVGAVLTGPRLASVTKAVASEGAGLQLPQINMLWLSLQIRSWMALGVTFLMVLKPEALVSIAAMIAAIVIAGVLSPATVAYFEHRTVCPAKS